MAGLRGMVWSTLRAEIENDDIVVAAPSTAAPIMRQIPGARHSSKTQKWSLPLSWATCVVMRGVIGKDLKVGDSLAEWARNELRMRVVPALALRETKVLEGEYAALIDEIEAS